MNKSTVTQIVWIALPVLVLLAGAAHAGTSGSEFNDLWTLLEGWSKGLLGRIIALTFVIVGLSAGVLRGSVMGFVVGVAAGVGLYLGPTIISNIVAATL